MLNRHENRRAFRLITGRSDENETRAFLCVDGSGFGLVYGMGGDGLAADDGGGRG